MKAEVYLTDFNIDPKMEAGRALDLILNLVRLDVKT